jgi:hypothetical protein
MDNQNPQNNEKPENQSESNNLIAGQTAAVNPETSPEITPPDTRPSRHWIWNFTLIVVLISQYLIWHQYKLTGTLIILFVISNHGLSIIKSKFSVQGTDFFTGWILMAPLFLYGANAYWVLPAGFRFSGTDAVILGVSGFLILWISFRSLPRTLDAPDLSSFQARTVLLVLIVFCVILRMQNATLPVGHYGYDQCEETHDARNVIDLSSHHFIFPYGARGPFFTYLVAGIWKLFPEASSLLMVRVALVLIEVLSLWVFYLLGKEFDGKRRTGIFFAALGAVSRQMIMKVFLGTYANCLILFVAFPLLMLFKLIKKPDFKHFLYWIFAVCIGNYAYVVYRPWTLVMILIVLIWILRHKEERAAGSSAWVLGLGVGGLWIFYFLFFSSFIEKLLGAQYKIPPFWSMVLFIFLLQSFLEVFWISRKDGRGRKLLYWATACGLAYFLVEPIFQNPAIYFRLKSVKIMEGVNFFSWDWMKVRFDEFYSVLYFFFWGGGDLATIGPPGDLFFDFFAIYAIALGLVVFLARPTGKMAFLFIPFLVGLSPRFGNDIMHSARLLGCIVPLYLFGAVGLNHLWEASRSTSNGKIVTRFLLLPVLILGLFLATKTNMYRANQWYFNYQDPEVTFYNQIKQENPASRIYAGFSSIQFPVVREISEILCEKRDIYMWNKSNPIYLAPDDKCEDVVFYFGGSELETMVKESFPKAQWTVIYNNANIPVMHKVLIPRDWIAENPKEKLHIARVPVSYWQRRLYDGYYGLAKGIILMEDRVLDPTVPFPPEIYGFTRFPPTCSIRGLFEVHSKGKYIFSSETSNMVTFFIDGKKVLDIRPVGKTLTQTGKIRLSAGSHSVEMKIHFRSGQNIPPVYVTPPDGSKFDLLSEATHPAN